MAGLSEARSLAGRRLAGRAAAVATVLAYSWLATTFRAFTWPMRITTALPGVVLFAAAARDRRRRARLRVWLSQWRTVLGGAHPYLPVRSKVAWRAGTMVWSLLIAAIAGWELMARLNGPRSQYPTISSMVGALTQPHAIRFLVFVLWLLFGRDLLRR
jgi:hypothetical protein